jgi:hypothetical protein
MTHVMCNPWKRTFTLVPLIPLTMFSPMNDIQCYQIHMLLGKTFAKISPKRYDFDLYKGLL